MRKILTFLVILVVGLGSALFAEVSVDYNFRSNDTELLNATTYSGLNISKSEWNERGLYVYSRGLRVSYIEDEPNSKLFRSVNSFGVMTYSLDNPNSTFGSQTDENGVAALLLGDIHGFQFNWRLGKELSFCRTDNFSINIECGVGSSISHITYDGTMVAIVYGNRIADFYKEKAYFGFMEVYIYPSVAIGSKLIKLLAGWEASYKHGLIKSEYECKSLGISSSSVNFYKYFSNNARIGIKCNF